MSSVVAYSFFNVFVDCGAYVHDKRVSCLPKPVTLVVISGDVLCARLLFVQTNHKSACVYSLVELTAVMIKSAMTWTAGCNR